MRITNKNLIHTQLASFSIILAAGVYEEGQVVTSIAGADWTHATPTGADNELVAVLGSKVTTATDGTGAVAYTGQFNLNKLVVAGTTYTALAGLLQGRGITAFAFNK